MKSKKGFTLIEMLTILVILSIISLVAVPNVVNMVEKNRKKQMVLDSKEMLNKFQNYKILGKCENNDTCTFSYTELGLEGKTDGFGDTYTEGSVVYKNKTYTIVLKTEKHSIDFSTKDAENIDISVDNIKDIINNNN